MCPVLLRPDLHSANDARLSGSHSHMSPGLHDGAAVPQSCVPFLLRCRHCHNAVKNDNEQVRQWGLAVRKSAGRPGYWGQMEGWSAGGMPAGCNACQGERHRTAIHALPVGGMRPSQSLMKQHARSSCHLEITLLDFGVWA